MSGHPVTKELFARKGCAEECRDASRAECRELSPLLELWRRRRSQSRPGWRNKRSTAANAGWRSNGILEPLAVLGVAECC